MQGVEAALAAAAERNPDGPAVIEARANHSVRITWRDLAERTAVLAAATRDAVPPGAVVLIDVANTADAVVRLVGALRSGRTVLPLPAHAPAGEIDRLADLAGRRYGAVYRSSGDLLEKLRSGPGRCTADHLLTGGGTTGRPKLSEGTVGDGLAGGMLMLLGRSGWDTGIRQLIVGPLYHAAPFTILVAGLLDRHTLVVQGAFSAAKTARTVERHAVQWMQLTPSHMRRMLTEPEVTAGRLASLRGVLHTAAPCDRLTKQGFNDLLGPERVFEMYGATERIGMTLASGAEWAARPGTVGKGFLTQIRILGEDGRSLPVGAEGRVFMRHGAGHRGHARTTASVEHTPDGFRSVGDHGRLDADGYLYLADRRTDMMTVGGSNVYPAEIERVILDLPGVQDVAVAGRSDHTLGAVPIAFVVPVTGSTLSAADVTRHCRTALAVPKRPREVRIVAGLPRTEAGKLHRGRLIDLIDPTRPTTTTEVAQP